ncbi:tripartite tricarboxylate transporter substrate binding protein [Roseococcus sp. SDR]|uniref:Bug family tripartite tricarboxylate transporter substrate binding protein n=1 Tax=Roseococcus sp. SDR TaxID=2835532 RepID=UPI001BCE8B50|nr:tripartite tricarboxylate transporter substrate binding protein [Roseococcus sp. SDR]MBS7790750.1 tripartite tricarboxylate transporter substrate binding protein [Roseococcus sp. SDR]MBV1846064.1 tripartite tricarboxylate transporter substrate binding protein [Roseococcus sp. SDR]
MPFTRRRLAQAGLALASIPAAARAQSFPDRPLRWVVGYPPGGASDTFARLIGAQMAARLGQSVVVENRPGGGALLASEMVARSPADGYTWMHVDNGILTYNPALFSRMPLNPDTDFTGIGFIGRFPLYIVVRPEGSPRSFADFLAAARTRAPTYGTPAVASPHHLAMELVRRRTGLEATHVPYRGGPAAMQDLLAGNVDSVVIDTATGLPFIRDGRVRALAVLSDARSPQAPDVPTMAELGHANTVAYGWQGMSVPVGTPAAIIQRLSTDMIAAIQSPEITARMTTLGIEYQPWTPAQFNAFVQAENALWRPLIRELGIRLDG